MYCKPSEEGTIVSKANGNKSIEVKSKSKSIIAVEPEEKPEVKNIPDSLGDIERVKTQ